MYIEINRTVDDICQNQDKPLVNVTLSQDFKLSCEEINVLNLLKEPNTRTRSNNDVISSLLEKGFLIKNPSCNGVYYTISPLAKHLYYPNQFGPWVAVIE
jgi:hypothetical protein